MDFSNLYEFYKKVVEMAVLPFELFPAFLQLEKVSGIWYNPLCVPETK